MSILGNCLPKRTGTRIYLSEEDEDENSYTSKSCFTSCCLPLYKTRGNNREGLIRLPEGTHRQTIDDYLDPRSPVSIEALLAEQEEELDHYYGQTDDEDAYHGPSVAATKYTPLSLNLVDTLSSSFFEEEDAQFLSEHRISAILVERPTLNSAHLFKDENNDHNNKRDSVLEQDFLDKAVPTTSTSTTSVSSRVFAIKIKDKEDGQHTTYDLITDSMHISSSPKEMKDFKLGNTTNRNQHIISSLSSSIASSTSVAHSDKAENNESLIPPIQTSTVLDATSLFVPAAATSSSFSFQNTDNHQQQQQRSEFPATTLTRVPYQPPPAMQANMPSQTLHQPVTPFINNPVPSHSSTTTSTLLQPQQQRNHQSNTAVGAGGRRPSVVAAAQNLLGDKLEDFTEKLAFIKKNIIMSLDSDDEDEHGFGTDKNNQHSNTNMKMSLNKNRQSRESGTLLDPRNKLASSSGSVEKSWDSFLPKFNNKKQRQSSSTSLLESSHSSQVFPPPRSSSIDHKQSMLLENQQDRRRFSNASVYSHDDQEDPFDFGKISKNVRTFGEGVMGNGLRMFNNISTRIKNVNNNHHSAEFDAQQMHHQQKQHVELL